MHRYESALISALKNGRQSSIAELLEKTGLKKEELFWAIENLLQRKGIEAERSESESVELTSEGAEYSRDLMPEESLLKKASIGRLSISYLKGKEEQIGFQWAKKKGLAEISKGIIDVTEKGRDAIKNGTEEGNALRSIAKNPENYFKLMSADKQAVLNLLDRKLITIKKKREIIWVKATPEAIKEFEKEKGIDQIDALDKAMISSASWKGKAFKPYDMALNVEREKAAIRHPIRILSKKLKEAYLSMGFIQASGPVIEPAFWVFDSLFIPQDHPARDLQDTFYLSNPEKIDISGEKSLEMIKKAHLESWGGEWKKEEAEQALLRTHTTNISVRNIRKVIEEGIAEGEGNLPMKLFSIGRVFRNENIDYRHLTDFYQHEGIVIGKNLTLSNLFHIMISVYKPLGLELKFKPAYFPFVEPGVEFYAYSEKTDELIEMGGAGIIRREITGVPRKNITVLAWGSGLERILLLRDPSIKGVTELYNSGVGWLRSRRIRW